jgi:FtsP/CotA-like multicopper oxidase with cupredoxin domain
VVVAVALLATAVAPMVLGQEPSAAATRPAEAAGAREPHQGHGGGASQPLPPIPDAESGTVVAGLPFDDPPVLASVDGVLDVDLTAAAQRVTISGKTVNARVYNGAFMPPVLRVRPGDRLRIHTRNELDQYTNMHTHGFFVAQDGNSDNIFVEVTPKATFENQYRLPRSVTPGTYWFHSHAHPHAEGQVFGGMSGIIEVDGLTALLPRRLRGVTDRVLALKDFQFDATNSIPGDDIDSNAPTHRTINGIVQPAMTMRPGETQLWRLANIGADIWYDLELRGHTFAVIADDGNPVDRVTRARHLVLPPGKRYDVLVQAPRRGTFALISRRFDQGAWGDTYPRTRMATLTVDGDPLPRAALPTRLRTRFDDLATAKVDVRRRAVFSETNKGNGVYEVNGRVFTDQRVDYTPRLGTVEEWTVLNTSREIHPFHIHVNDFQVMSVNGRPNRAHSLQDTIPLPARRGRTPGTVVIRMRINTFTGKYVFHCHILGHEDLGMMGAVNVS